MSRNTGSLADLFMSLFTANELRRFISDVAGDVLVASMPSGGSLAALAFETADLLHRRGLIDPGLFNALKGTRPRRIEDIERVAREFDLADAAQGIPPVAMSSTAGWEGWAFGSGLKALCVVAESDLHHFQRLQVHTHPLVQTGDLQIRAVDAGTSAEIDAALTDADLILFFVTADLLASVEDLDGLVARAGDTRVVPVMVGRALWERTALFAYAAVPSRGTISEREDVDGGWAEVAEVVARYLEPEAPEFEQTVPTVGEFLPVAEVFAARGVPKHTFVKPSMHKQLFAEMQVQRRPLVVEGPSGIGKTVAVQVALRKLAAWVPRAEIVNARDAAGVRRIEAVVAAGAGKLRGHFVIDDFHQLDVDIRRQVAHTSKVLYDLPDVPAKITMIGIPRTQQSLLSEMRDLTGVTAIRLERASPTQIETMIEQGEKVLNVDFAIKSEMARGAMGSLAIAQRLCEVALIEAEIFETQPTRTRVQVAFATLKQSVLQDAFAQLWPMLRAFAMLDEGVLNRGAGVALLYHLGLSFDGSVDVGDIRAQYPRLQGAFDRLLHRVAHGERVNGFAEPWEDALYCNHRAGQPVPVNDFWTRTSRF